MWLFNNKFLKIRVGWKTVIAGAVGGQQEGSQVWQSRYEGGRIGDDDSKGVQVDLLKSKYRCCSMDELKLTL